jgi:hypothetical protein
MSIDVDAGMSFVRVKCSKTHFFESLIADQMHDFLLHVGPDERASSMATVFEVLDKFEDTKCTDVERLVRIWQTTVDPKRSSRFKRILRICSNQFSRPPTASQTSAEFIVTSPQLAPAASSTPPSEVDEAVGEASDKGKFHEYGTRIADFVPISKMVDRMIAPRRTSGCKMFDAPLFTYVRPLDADEFDCYISRLRDFNEHTTPDRIDPLISIVVDATKNRDITLMSNLSLRLKTRAKEKARWTAQAMFQSILPNMFDQAGSDSHVTEQRNMNFFGIHRPEVSCEFEIIVDPDRKPVPSSANQSSRHIVHPLSGHRLMSFELIRLPNVFEVMYHCTDKAMQFSYVGQEKLSIDASSGRTMHHAIFGDHIVRDESAQCKKLLDDLDRTMHEEAFRDRAAHVESEEQKALFKMFFDGVAGKKPFKTNFVLYDRFGYRLDDDGYSLYGALSPVIKVKRLIHTLTSMYNELQHRWLETCNESRLYPTIVDHMLAWIYLHERTEFNMQFLSAFAPRYAGVGLSPTPKSRRRADRRAREEDVLANEMEYEMPKASADFMYAVCVGETPAKTFHMTIRALLIKWSVMVGFLDSSTGPMDMQSFGYIYALLHPHELAVCSHLTLFGENDTPIDFDETLRHLNRFFVRDGSGPSVAKVGDTLLEIYAERRHNECNATLTGTSEPIKKTVQSKKQSIDVKWKDSTYKLTPDEYDRLFESGYVTYDHSLVKTVQGFDKNAFHKIVLGAMLLKTLCDLSITTWCAYRNQHKSSREKHLLLTFDRLSASIATLFAEMEHYILFQSVDAHRKTICVHPNSGAFASEIKRRCFEFKSENKFSHVLEYGKDSIEWSTMKTLVELVPTPRPQFAYVPPSFPASDDADVLDDNYKLDDDHFFMSDLDYNEQQGVRTLASFQLPVDDARPDELRRSTSASFGGRIACGSTRRSPRSRTCALRRGL